QEARRATSVAQTARDPWQGNRLMDTPAAPREPTTDLGGPVSQAVADDLRTWVRRHGVVVWLDADDHYSALVERLEKARQANQLPYDVFAYRGSFLEL